MKGILGGGGKILIVARQWDSWIELKIGFDSNKYYAICRILQWDQSNVDTYTLFQNGEEG